MKVSLSLYDDETFTLKAFCYGVGVTLGVVEGDAVTVGVVVGVGVPRLMLVSSKDCSVVVWLLALVLLK